MKKVDRLNAYKGNKPYIFLSYSHKDTKRVMPIIHRLQQDGFRVWYDDGIDPGVEWDEYIASRVSGCGCFLALMSANYLASDNCRDELKFGRDIRKPQVLLYLESITLPSGMAMRLGRCPSISVKGKNRIIVCWSPFMILAVINECPVIYFFFIRLTRAV